MLILNDIHLGVQRSAGTTLASATSLRNWLLGQTTQVLADTDGPVLIAGDLFDGFNVTTETLAHTYFMFSTWLAAKTQAKLYLLPGNHDLSRDSTKMSSFHLLQLLLSAQFPAQVVNLNEPGHVAGNIYAVPHLANQELFDAALAEMRGHLQGVPGEKWLVLHANYDNHFAVQADHSLNVTPEQADEFALVDTTLLFAHEHQTRQPKSNVICMGNQFPSSIADCLGNDAKFAHVIIGDLMLDKVKTWQRQGSYAELDWTLDLASVDPDLEFIRVVGTADYTDNAAVVDAINTLRQSHPAFVITNAVQIKSLNDQDDTAASLEAAQEFDVLAYVYAKLDAKQVEKLKELQHA